MKDAKMNKTYSQLGLLMGAGLIGFPSHAHAGDLEKARHLQAVMAVEVAHQRNLTEQLRILREKVGQKPATSPNQLWEIVAAVGNVWQELATKATNAETALVKNSIAGFVGSISNYRGALSNAVENFGEIESRLNLEFLTEADRTLENIRAELESINYPEKVKALCEFRDRAIADSDFDFCSI